MLSVPKILLYLFYHVGKTNISSSSHIQPQFCACFLGLRPFLHPAWSPVSTRSYSERLEMNMVLIKVEEVEPEALRWTFSDYCQGSSSWGGKVLSLSIQTSETSVTDGGVTRHNLWHRDWHDADGSLARAGCGFESRSTHSQDALPYKLNTIWAATVTAFIWHIGLIFRYTFRSVIVCFIIVLHSRETWNYLMISSDLEHTYFYYHRQLERCRRRSLYLIGYNLQMKISLVVLVCPSLIMNIILMYNDCHFDEMGETASPGRCYEYKKKIYDCNK